MILMTVPCNSVLHQSDLHRGVYFVNKEKGTLEENTMLHVVPRSGLNDVNGTVYPGFRKLHPGLHGKRRYATPDRDSSRCCAGVRKELIRVRNPAVSPRKRTT